MRKAVFVLSFGVLGLLVLVSAVVFSQTDTAGRNDVRFKQTPADFRPEFYPARPPFEPLGDVMSVANEEDPLQQVVADLLRHQAPSQGRSAHFAPITSKPEYHLDGWYLKIGEVTDVRGVLTFTVEITPRIRHIGGGIPTVIGGFTETYELRDDTLKLVKAEHPAGYPGVGALID